MPALPSSTGLITSFGGLKKEESLGKSTSLTRQTLGITFKRSKIENNSNLGKTKDGISDVAEDKSSAAKMEVKDDDVAVKNDGKHNHNHKIPEVESSDESGDDINIEENIKKQIQQKITESAINLGKRIEIEVDTLMPTKDAKQARFNEAKPTKKISLVCDYSSSGESSEG